MARQRCCKSDFFLFPRRRAENANLQLRAAQLSGTGKGSLDSYSSQNGNAIRREKPSEASIAATDQRSTAVRPVFDGLAGKEYKPCRMSILQLKATCFGLYGRKQPLHDDR